MIDILYLGAVFPRACSIMAKKELKYTPFLGQYITLGNNVFVDRTSRTDALRTFANVAETMKRKGISLFVFAEGTRSASEKPTLLPFKKGAFHLAVQGQVPVVPVVSFPLNSNPQPVLYTN
jgi:lysophosphatidate acyltransferase